MKRPTTFILIGVAVVVAFFIAFPPSPRTHGDGMFPILVSGRLVAPGDGAPIAGAFVMTAPSPSAARARLAGGSYRERIDEWMTYETTESAAGRGAPDPHSAPWSSGGARTREDGAFSIAQTLLWSYDREGWWQSRPSHPPPRSGIRVLAIEIDARDPVILDVPEGTWSEHDDEDGLWATWDLGVVVVPGRP